MHRKSEIFILFGNLLLRAVKPIFSFSLWITRGEEEPMLNKAVYQ